MHRTKLKNSYNTTKGRRDGRRFDAHVQVEGQRLWRGCAYNVWNAMLRLHSYERSQGLLWQKPTCNNIETTTKWSVNILQFQKRENSSSR